MSGKLGFFYVSRPFIYYHLLLFFFFSISSIIFSPCVVAFPRPPNGCGWQRSVPSRQCVRFLVLSFNGRCRRHPTIFLRQFPPTQSHSHFVNSNISPFLISPNKSDTPTGREWLSLSILEQQTQPRGMHGKMAKM
jgi:hypothetical protein